ncbi:MAG TPA: Ig-like domain-containing protein, partial [Gemmatimonadaceae bacterium]
MFAFSIRTVVSGGAIALFLISCTDSTAPSGTPASVRIVSGDAQTGAAGQKLSTPPRFIVEDANGRAVSNAHFTVTVAAGSGAIADVPGKTSGGPTSVGTWTLGQRVGADTLTVAVDGLAPLVVTATATAGPAAAITTTSPTTLSGRVGEAPANVPHVRVTDAFGNPLSSAQIHLSLSGGGSVSSAITTNANGEADITDWAFSTTSGA